MLKKMSSNRSVVDINGGDRSPMFGSKQHIMSLDNTDSLIDEVLYQTVLENAAEEDLGETELINKIHQKVHS